MYTYIVHVHVLCIAVHVIVIWSLHDLLTDCQGLEAVAHCVGGSDSDDSVHHRGVCCTPLPPETSTSDGPGETCQHYERE